MQSFHLVIIGEPIPCDRRGCGEPASVLLREHDEDGDAIGIAYCDTCWLAVRRLYSPLTAQDAVRAQSEAERAIVFRDRADDTSQ